VSEFVEAALSAAGLNGPIEEYVDFDKEMIRPSEVDLLVGDGTKAKNVLGWVPKTSFKELVALMVENDLKAENI
jgi:GDPmannose 4,6-dehydratase